MVNLSIHQTRISWRISAINWSDWCGSGEWHADIHLKQHQNYYDKSPFSVKDRAAYRCEEYQKEISNCTTKKITDAGVSYNNNFIYGDNNNNNDKNDNNDNNDNNTITTSGFHPFDADVDENAIEQQVNNLMQSLLGILNAMSLYLKENPFPLDALIAECYAFAIKLVTHCLPEMDASELLARDLLLFEPSIEELSNSNNYNNNSNNDNNDNNSINNNNNNNNMVDYNHRDSNNTNINNINNINNTKNINNINNPHNTGDFKSISGHAPVLKIYLPDLHLLCVPIVLRNALHVPQHTLRSIAQLPQ